MNLKSLLFNAVFAGLLLLSCSRPAVSPQFPTGEMTDPRDGRKYKTVKIGNQWWMAENLNYYTQEGSWYYNNDSLTNARYGRLYLWETAMKGNPSSSSNPSRITGIAPPGWHIPSDAEWDELDAYLKAHSLTADDLKSNGKQDWKPTNSGTNKTNFNALPAGTVFDNGQVSANIEGYATFLSTTVDGKTDGVWGRDLQYDKSQLLRMPIGKENAWSLRCVKD